jgi:hypothetical protein
MANIYNYGLSGTNNIVQFGKGGPQLLTNSSTNFAAVASDGVTLVRFKTADPTSTGDVVTFNFLQNTASVLNANIATVQTSIGNTIANSASLNNSVSTLNLVTVRRDGTTPFTGNVSLSGYSLSNVAAPVNPNDAVTLTYLNNTISNFGNVFSYVGVLSNAAGTSNTATSLASLTGPNGHTLVAGDYFKSTVAGYYKANSSATAFYVNANDGIVYNTANGFDVLGHVDSTISGTANLIDVSGSVDTGFVVTIDPVFTGYVSTLQGNVVQLSNSINLVNANVVSLSNSLAGMSSSQIITVSNNTSVKVSDANGITGYISVSNVSTQIISFTGNASTNTNLNFNYSTANSVSIVANGTSANVSLVLVPRGTGVVSVSGALIQNVANGIANTDATNVGQVNAAITTAVSALQTGIIYSHSIYIPESNGAYTIGTPITGTLVRARVIINSVFDANTIIEVGSSSYGTDLLDPSHIDGTLANTAFDGDLSSVVSSQQLYASVTTTIGTTGNATVLVEYIHN